MPDLSRRRLLAGAAVVLAGVPALTRTAAAAPGPTAGPTTAGPTPAVPTPATPPVAPVPGAARSAHAVGDPRGSDVVARFGRAREARFGTMFKDLPAFSPDDALLTALAARMVESRGPADDIRDDGLDNPTMPAGHVYLGQFVDHDMTRDTTPLDQARADPSALTNFDSPHFDLGCVYGGGRAADPDLYEADGRLRLVTNVHGLPDLPRRPDGTAFVGDPRNDENLVVAQLQAAFIRLHNRFLDREAAGSFDRARELARWHYQWVIVHDFLPRVVGAQTVDDVLDDDGRGRPRARTVFYTPGNPARPMMPIEYSVAAYRWGHSGIRPEYEMHDTALSPNPAVLPIFSTDVGPTARDLRGSRPLFPDATVDWNYFFEIPGVSPPDDLNMARRIDTQVARPLRELPDSVVAHSPGAVLALALRNLLRGKRLGLPAGQDVAEAMRRRVRTMPPALSNAELGLTEPGWGGRAPLWFYVLREAELGGGHHLGPVGGRIVAEVVLGLLQVDRTSYVNARTPFVPIGGPGFAMGDLLRLAGAPIVVPDPGDRPSGTGTPRGGTA